MLGVTLLQDNMQQNMLQKQLYHFYAKEQSTAIHILYSIARGRTELKIDFAQNCMEQDKSF